MNKMVDIINQLNVVVLEYKQLSTIYYNNYISSYKQETC